MTRDEIYRHFGPKLIEAITLIIKDEINLLRAQLDLPERNNLQLMDAIENKLSTLDNYKWMDTKPFV